MTIKLRPTPRHTRFAAGDEATVSGLRVRIRQGRKGPNDLVLEWHTPSGWRAVDMAAVCMMVEFLFMNEDVLYPPQDGYLGGEMFLGAIRHAIDAGHQSVQQYIDECRKRGTNRPAA